MDELQELLPTDPNLSESFIHELTSFLDEQNDLEAQGHQADQELTDSFIKALTTYIDQPPTPPLTTVPAALIDPDEEDDSAPTLPIERPTFTPNTGLLSTHVPTSITETTILQRTAPQAASGQSWKNKLADYYRSASVRVDVKRLNRLNNLVSELMTQENGALLQSQHLQSTIHTVAKRFHRFSHIIRGLNEWIDHSQNPQARLSSHQSAFSQASSEFDPLQMDAYSPLYTIAQDVIEEMAQLGEAIQDMTVLDQNLHETYRQRQQTLKQIHSDLLQTQMLPLADIVQRFPRMMRDLSLQHHKRVSLKLSGTNTLIDKAILDKLMDPLVHLLRNAFDHGIEMPALREVNGKPAEATIEIRAYQRGNQSYIEIRDDGRGIDPEVIRHKLVARKLITIQEAEQLSHEELYEYIFYPGFSTAAKVTELSGRGVGMDAVRTQVRQLKGTISLKSAVGKGTIFTLRFPLTLTVANLLVFHTKGLLFAIPTDTIAGLASIKTTFDLEQINQRQITVEWEGQNVSLYPPELLLRHYPLPQRPQPQLPNIPLPQDGDLTILVIAGDQGMIGIPIDEVLQEQELVVKPFGQILTPPTYLYGCTILGDGSLVPIFDAQALVKRWRTIDWSTFRNYDGTTIQPREQNDNITILVVDDSLTARQFVALTLEKEGYQVVQARDGREALQQLHQNPQIKAVFCDVEMPRMNGFEFLEQCRQNPNTMTLPILMLTSRSGEKHQQKAQSLGATAYLIKPYLEQELLNTLANHLMLAPHR
jgi:two-component system, chemotaxis family, sensor histidine kinase and response regulator PixL